MDNDGGTTTTTTVEKLGQALESLRPLICEHDEFRDDCPKCLRRRIKYLEQQVQRLEEGR